MEIKTDALVLRCADSGENDKMVTLLTAELGKVGAMMKGVKKVGAKLRVFAQPFCFAEVVLFEKEGRRRVISASLHDGFFSLLEDLASFYGAAVVARVCDTLSFEGMESRPLLVSAVKALEGLCADQEPLFSLVPFFVDALAFAGYQVSAGACPFCGKELEGRMRFDLSLGAFACRDCGQGVEASETTYRAVKAAIAGEKIGDRDGALRAFRLLCAYFFEKTGTQLREAEEFLRVI